jgi:antitoxin MazE
MRTALRKMGNSSGIIIPKGMLREIGAQVGEELDLKVEDGRLIAVPLRQVPRAGWAAAAREIADEAPVWPEFANDGDDALEW